MSLIIYLIPKSVYESNFELFINVCIYLWKHLVWELMQTTLVNTWTWKCQCQTAAILKLAFDFASFFFSTKHLDLNEWWHKLHERNTARLFQFCLVLRCPVVLLDFIETWTHSNNTISDIIKLHHLPLVPQNGSFGVSLTTH